MAAFELHSSRRCASQLSRKLNILKGLAGRPFRTSEAHRLPKKCWVCIDATPPSQAEMAGKSSFRRGRGAEYLKKWLTDHCCAVTPVCLITLRYFALSFCTKSLNWPTDIGVTTAPAASSRALTSGSWITRLISLLRRSMIDCGVFRGAKKRP